jgi:hypothetical protein
MLHDVNFLLLRGDDLIAELLDVRIGDGRVLANKDGARVMGIAFVFAPRLRVYLVLSEVSRTGNGGQLPLPGARHTTPAISVADNYTHDGAEFHVDESRA